MDVIPRDGERIVTQPGNSTSAGAVISRIESILESILDCLGEGEELCINLTTDGDGQTTQRIRYPGKCAKEATKFGMHCCSSE
jgi:meiotic recombination protein SPO11